MMLRRYKHEMWRLQHVDAKNLPQMGVYGSKLARVLRCIDGDTVQVVLVLDNNAVITNVRLCGIDAPELRPSRKNPHRDAIKREAEAAKHALEHLLPKDKLCTLYCCGPLDCYGRVLAKSIVVEKVDVVSEMVRRGYAVRIDGKKRQTDWSRMWKDLQTQRLAYSNAIAYEKTKKERDLCRKEKKCWKRLFCSK